MVQRIPRGIIFFLLGLDIPFLVFGLERTNHYSFSSDNPKPLLEAIHRYKDSKPPETHPTKQWTACVVTHHFLANRLMVECFEILARQKGIHRIILIGPDHFNRSKTFFAVSALPWKTPCGMLYTDRRIVRRLSKLPGAGRDDSAFFGEHSIGIPISFIGYYLPKAKILPVMIRPCINMDHLNLLAKELNKLLDRHTLVLLSMDFSHGKNAQQAGLEDAKSSTVIRNFDCGKVWDLDVDCRAGLYLLLRLCRGMNVSFVAHTNASEITSRNLKNCTSYFTILFGNNQKDNAS